MKMDHQNKSVGMGQMGNQLEIETIIIRETWNFLMIIYGKMEKEGRSTYHQIQIISLLVIRLLGSGLLL